MSRLVNSAGAEVVGRMVQKLPRPSPVSYIGKGKLAELAALRDSLQFNTIVIDEELTPIQQRNLEETLKVKIIDRVALILDIFASRAQTREGRLQVELAQHQYLLPRLAGQWSHLERLGGGIGTRGPGESQLETDRRLIRQKIGRLEKQLEDVRKRRELYRQRRRKSGIPVVSLVGYTNAGKSALLNALSQAGVAAEDRPFSTLDPTTRRLTLPDRTSVLLTDTVGFIRKLPPTIISAFRATLEELTEANLLIHVVDITSPGATHQCETVEQILEELDVAGKPRVTALNKIDLLLDEGRRWDEDTALEHLYTCAGPSEENTVLISAVKGWGMTRLLEKVAAMVRKSQTAPV